MIKENKVLYEGEWMRKREALKQFEIDKKQKSWSGCQLTCSCGYVWNTKKAIGLPAKCPSCGDKFDVSVEKSHKKYFDPKTEVKG